MSAALSLYYKRTIVLEFVEALTTGSASGGVGSLVLSSIDTAKLTNLLGHARQWQGFILEFPDLEKWTAVARDVLAMRLAVRVANWDEAYASCLKLGEDMGRISYAEVSGAKGSNALYLPGVYGRRNIEGGKERKMRRVMRYCN